MRTVLVLAMAAASLAGCGSDHGSASRPGQATVVVTTNILGDVVQEMVGADVRVDVLMPPGSDPHEFAASARQAAAMRTADALVVNGLGLEGALADTIRAARTDGVPVITAADVLPADAHDPHFFSDPVLMRQAAGMVADALATALPALDTPAFRQRVDRYLAALAALDGEVRTLLAPIPPERRALVTNHEVFGYFARRYHFVVLGAVLPGGSTLAQPSAADLAALARLVSKRRLPAVFADTSSPARLVEALAAEGANVTVVPLFSESLGPTGSAGATYIAMMRTNAQRIAAALG